MLVELVQTTTRDGLRLDGIFSPSAGAGSSALAVDAFCFLHGTGGNYYSSSLFDDLGERLRELGIGVLRVNTRGHDGVSTAQTSQGGRRQGAAYEVIDDCRHDVAAWLDWLRQRLGPRVGLLGHSMGALKGLYAVAHEPHNSPVCVVAISPPRLSYSWFCSSPEGEEFLQTYQRAEQHAVRGQAGALLEVKLPLPFLITAGGYLEKYGPQERYNYLRFLVGVDCPTLITFGSVEVEKNMAFRDAPQAVAELASKRKHLSVETIAGADHFYNGSRTSLSAGLESWLRRTST
ncbi:MAG TPA: alpha/beta fold hydrolase [Gemmataceae bacterium]|jgi:pimeloyl-ACP methyl ester carboxylesterase